MAAHQDQGTRSGFLEGNTCHLPPTQTNHTSPSVRPLILIGWARESGAAVMSLMMMVVGRMVRLGLGGDWVYITVIAIIFSFTVYGDRSRDK